ncbi:MAG: hypothetical protein M1818_007032 [Claussenomyces sp. TS43310]|nr:MAG: hypothetical protein M1818_007032 [Claussenomyces sp. TS43310]
MRIFNRVLPLLFWVALATSKPIATAFQHLLGGKGVVIAGHGNASLPLFADLEELARIVDIAYCVGGGTGIQSPFLCASRCSEFPNFQLVDTWNTGPLMSDSCGYIALDHSASGRVIVAFRGTYSIANTIVDLSTIPQEYVPYPGDPEDEGAPLDQSIPGRLRRLWECLSSRRINAEAQQEGEGDKPSGPKCRNCTVHMGFLTSWMNTRSIILPHLEKLRDEYPGYSLHLVGHSLGGAVAALAGLEFEVMGWRPTVTTFGEPRLGNRGLRIYLDELFGLGNSDADTISSNVIGGHGARFRRVTHVDDPVPLLPLGEWGFLMHSGEIYISKPALSPTPSDVHLCSGDEDPRCIAGADSQATSAAVDELHAFAQLWRAGDDAASDTATRERAYEVLVGSSGWGLPARYKMWQLFFAHRDYFWRLGLCIPGGDPLGWLGRGGNIASLKQEET